MESFEESLHRIWIAIGSCPLLLTDRKNLSTYIGVPLDARRPTGVMAPDLSWLTHLPSRTLLDRVFRPGRRGEFSRSSLNSQANELEHLSTALEQAHRLGLYLPPTFRMFMESPDHQAMVLTCTDCYLSLGDQFVEVTDYPDTYLYRFMNDSQFCVLWYLLLQPDSLPMVVASSFFLEPDAFKEIDYGPDVDYASALSCVTLCGDSFDEFLYHFWMENSIWYAHRDGIPLSPDQEEYVNYLQSKAEP